MRTNVGLAGRCSGRVGLAPCFSPCLAFGNVDTDWHLWVEVGERPILTKSVITSETVNSAS